MDPLFLDIKRAAEAVSMSPRWIRQQIAEGLPHLRTEGKILIASEDLRAWMKDRYTPKPVDLEEAHRLAEELTTGRRRGKKKRT
ncbi:MAG: hypothetical protein IH577_04455 [Deltaproteobacteria bacterium]|nr:hypothetical protein [Deltaproteobacteria bacterium]